VFLVLCNSRQHFIVSFFVILQILWLKLLRSFLFLDLIFYTYSTVIILMTFTISTKVSEEDRISLVDRFMNAKMFMFGNSQSYFLAKSFATPYKI
jgi:hypothetical protein